MAFSHFYRLQQFADNNVIVNADPKTEKYAYNLNASVLLWELNPIWKYEINNNNYPKMVWFGWSERFQKQLFSFTILSSFVRINGKIKYFQMKNR